MWKYQFFFTFLPSQTSVSDLSANVAFLISKGVLFVKGEKLLFFLFLCMYVCTGGRTKGEEKRDSKADSTLSKKPNMGLDPTTGITTWAKTKSIAYPTEPRICPKLFVSFIYILNKEYMFLLIFHRVVNFSHHNWQEFPKS